MGRGYSSGGGQSSLGYLFGATEAPKAAANSAPTTTTDDTTAVKPASSSPADIAKQAPAGIQCSNANNYFRANGQNTGNFITGRPTTKVHAAPGGGSSLGYLFGSPGGSN